MNTDPQGLAAIPGLPPALLAKAFPFFLAWDHELRLTACGPSLLRICPAAVPGGLLTGLVQLRRPTGELTLEFFRHCGELLLLLEVVGNGVTLRGQVVALQEPESFLLLASPWFFDPADVERLGLTLSDFALHDQTMDLLATLQTQHMANQELQQLTALLTEQRAKLRQQEAEARKLALVAARTDNGVVVSDARGRIEWVNDGFVRLTGWTLAEVIGKTPGSFLQGPETDPVAVAGTRAKLTSGEGFQVELLNYHRSGRKYWVTVEVQPILNEAGKVVNFMAIQADITARIHEERRRSVQYEVSRILANADSLDDAGIGIVKTICQGFGWAVGDLWLPDEAGDRLAFAGAWHAPADACADFLADSRDLTFRRGAGLPGRVWESGQIEWVPDVLQDGNFSRIDAAKACGLRGAIALPFFNGGEFQGMLGFFSPVIDEPDEAMLQTLNSISNQIGQFVVRKRAESELIRAKEAAEFANRAKSDFLATMSHEIRTPMNGVLGFTQLLQRSPMSAQQQDFVAAIRTSAESLLCVINDVLDFSKIESGRMEPESSAFNLQTCIEDALETVSNTAAEKHLDLAARLSSDVPSAVVGDALRLRQVLVNLLSNAVKFTLHGEVLLDVSAASATAGRVRLAFSVSDTGIGIPPETLQTLFQPFQQADSTTSRRFGGSGLGLAICRRLVELMGGTIAASSRPGEGSVFCFELELPVSDHPPAVVAPVPFPSLFGRRVLIVDGHPLSRRVISELLERWGLEVRAAAAPEAAENLLADWQPHVLLVDSGYGSQVEMDFALGLVARGCVLYVTCQPGDGLALRERFGAALAGVLFKPLRVSPLFNALLAQADQSSTGAAPAGRLRAPLQTSGRPLRLLLAEDNPINRKLALAALSQMGCAADVAVDGNEAVQAAKVTRYDAILMDVHMPDMDGLEATRTLRRWETETGTPPVRIIALTANALAGDREICLNAGMDDYLPKPVRLEALQKALQNACDGGLAEPAPAASQDPAAGSLAPAALRQLADELSPDDAASLASDFLADLDEQVGSIGGAIDLGNADEARRLAHSLKGTASIFALGDLQSAANVIENFCRDGQLAEAAEAQPGLLQAAASAASELRAALAAVSSTILKSMS
ncbi:MAG: response regulator [Akkermansiaceae bacterium]|nr:response regulator [Akkermansiaceae bacterium]